MKIIYCACPGIMAFQSRDFKCLHNEIVKLEVVGETWVFVSNIENTTYPLMAGLEMIERAFPAHLSRNDFDTK